MDRFFRGFTAGIIGGFLGSAWTLFVYYVLKQPILRYLDWASVLLYGDMPQTGTQAFYALLIYLVWTGFLGIAMAYLMLFFGSRGYLLKGALIGTFLGFILYGITILFKVPFLEKPSFISVIHNHIAGLIWGLTTAAVLRYLDHRFADRV